MQNAIQQAITSALAGRTLESLKWIVAEQASDNTAVINRFGAASPAAHIKRLVGGNGVFTDGKGVINMGDIRKAAVPAATVTNTPNLVFPPQRAGVLYQTPVTTPVLEQLKAFGAIDLAAFSRIVTQAANLTAARLPNEDSPIPAAAPASAFTTTDMARFGLILAVTRESLSMSADDSVLGYVAQQLDTAINNALDVYFADLVAASSVTAASAQAAIAALADPRFGVFVGAPDTLIGLQDAVNTDPTVSYKTRPVIQSLAVPADTLWLVQANRVSITDPFGNEVSRTDQASIVMDSAPGDAPANASQPVGLFQENMSALKIVRKLSAKLLSPVQVIELA